MGHGPQFALPVDFIILVNYNKKVTRKVCLNATLKGLRIIEELFFITSKFLRLPTAFVNFVRNLFCCRCLISTVKKVMYKIRLN